MGTSGLTKRRGAAPDSSRLPQRVEKEPLGPYGVSERYNSPERNKGNQACAAETNVTPRRRALQIKRTGAENYQKPPKFTDNSSNPMAEANKHLPPTSIYILVA